MKVDSIAWYQSSTWVILVDLYTSIAPHLLMKNSQSNSPLCRSSEWKNFQGPSQPAPLLQQPATSLVASHPLLLWLPPLPQQLPHLPDPAMIYWAWTATPLTTCKPPWPLPTILSLLPTTPLEHLHSSLHRPMVLLQVTWQWVVISVFHSISVSPCVQLHLCSTVFVFKPVFVPPCVPHLLYCTLSVLQLVCVSPCLSCPICVACCLRSILFILYM